MITTQKYIRNRITSLLLKKGTKGIPGWLSGLAPAFGPGHDPGVPGSSPASGSWHMEPASLSACVSASLSLSLYIYLRFFLFIHERHRERGRDTGRGRSRILTGSLMRDSIPRLGSHPEPKATEPPRQPCFEL